MQLLEERVGIHSRKRPRTQKSSRANIHAFRSSKGISTSSMSRNPAEALPSEVLKASRVHAEFVPPNLTMFSDINCCEKAKNSKENHLMNHFRQHDDSSDFNAAYKFVCDLRRSIMAKTDDEMNAFISQECRRCCIPADSNTKRLIMNYEISGVQLCRKSFADCYGFPADRLKRAAGRLKQGKPLVGKMRSFTDATRANFTYAEARDLLATNNCDYIPDHVQGAIIPESDAHQIALLWLRDYFDSFDKHPEEEDLIYIQTSEKADVYEEYKTVMNESFPTLPQLSQGQLLELWRVAFPLSQLRPTASVIGKCSTCAIIDNVRNETTDINVRKACAHCHALHRGTFLGERIQYKQRIMAALRRPKRVLSMIIDGMDQNKTHIPKLSSQMQFPNPLDQHVTAVKRHGHGIRFYCTHHTVHKGASLTVYCILSELEVQ